MKALHQASTSINFIHFLELKQNFSHFFNFHILPHTLTELLLYIPSLLAKGRFHEINKGKVQRTKILTQCVFTS